MRSSYLMCLIAILFFSTLEFSGKLFDSQITPLTITGYRFFIGSLILFVPALYQYRKKKMQLKAIDFLKISLPGVLNIAVSMYFLQLGIYYGKAVIAAILISSNSIFVIIFAQFLLHEKVSKGQLIGILIGISGLLLVIMGNSASGDVKVISVSLGILFSVLASITFALFTVISKKMIRTYSNTVFNAISFFSGSIVLLGLGVILKVDLNPVHSMKDGIILVYLGLFVSGLAYLLFFQGLKKLPASAGSMFFLLKPVFATTLAVLLLKESFSMLQGFGVVLILFGMSFDHLYKFVKSKRSDKTLLTRE